MKKITTASSTPKIWCIPLTDTEEEYDSQIVKRSVLLAGHRTSVSLERAFWDVFIADAAARGLSINQLVSEVDATRKGNLSSALRVYILKRLASGSGVPPQAV